MIQLLPPTAPARSVPVAAHGLSPNAHRLSAILFLLLAAATLCRYFLTSLVYADVFHYDSFEHIPWTYRYADPQLFAGDLIQDYWEKQLGTAGMCLLFRTSSGWVNPLDVCELAQFLTGFLLLIAVYRAAQVVTGSRRPLALLSVVLFIGLFSVLYGWNHMSGGFSRSYGYPIIAFGLWAALTNRFFTIGLAAGLGALFYPPAFLIVGLFAGCCVLYPLAIRRVAAVALLGVPAAAFVLWWHGGAIPVEIGPAFDWQTAVAEPELHPGGTLPLIVSQQWWRNVLLSSPTSTVSLTVVVLAVAGQAAVAVVLRRPHLRPRREVVALTAAAVILFVAGWVAFMHLYEPSRFVRYTVPFILWLLATDWVCLVVGGDRHESVPAARSAWQPVLATVAVVMTAGWMATQTVVALQAREAGTACGSTPRLPMEIYTALRATPTDTVVVGHPNDCLDIPLIARRPVLTHPHCYFPYRQSFFAEMKDRGRAALCVLYATGPEEVEKYVHDHRIDLLLVCQKHFAKPTGWSGPTDQLAQEVYAAADGKFLFAEPPAHAVVCRIGEFTLLDLRRVVTSPR